MVAISSIVGFVVSAIFKLGSSSIVLGNGDSKIKEVKNAKAFIAGRALVGEKGKQTAEAIRAEIDKYDYGSGYVIYEL